MPSETRAFANRRPWKVEGPFPGQRETKKRHGFRAYANILDANGFYIAQGLDPDTAAFIVEAVNERESMREANERLQLALGEAEASAECNLVPEINRLRRLVRQMIPAVEEAFQIAKQTGESIKGICALKGVDSSEVDDVLFQWVALLHEARAAIAAPESPTSPAPTSPPANAAELRGAVASIRGCGIAIKTQVNLRNATAIIAYAGKIVSIAEAVLAACRLAHEEGDDTLCAEIDCPWRGEPNGCNHPTGYREVESPTSLAPTGNAAAMREALMQIGDCIKAACGAPQHAVGYLAQIDKLARAALSAPPRNCDVGTADEQADRFKAFCYANRTPDNECSKECPFNDTSAVCYCQARWAQMSYEKKEENSNG